MEKNIDILSEFELSENLAKIYLAIVQLGFAPVKNISMASKVRREEVYRALPKLERLGLVEREITKPLKFRAIPPEEALSILISHKQEKLNEKISTLMVKKKEFLENYKLNNEKIIVEDDTTDFVLTSEKELIIHKFNSLIDDAKRSINIVVPKDKLIQLVFFCSTSLRKAKKRDVKIRVITTCSDEVADFLSIIEQYIPENVIDLRCVNRLTSHFMIIDSREAMITTSTAEQNIADSPHLWTDNSCLIDLIQKDFEFMHHDSGSKKDYKK